MVATRVAGAVVMPAVYGDDDAPANTDFGGLH